MRRPGRDESAVPGPAGPADPSKPSQPPPRRGPSLRARALRLLAMREHSRDELVRKLAAHAESPQALVDVLDALERAGHLSEQRFVESLLQRRASRYGRRRIEQELDQHGVGEAARLEALRQVSQTERERALSVWRKRFGQPPASLAERGRQHRFLAARGFDAETIAWVLKHGGASDV